MMIIQSEKSSMAFLDRAPVIAGDKNWQTNYEAEIKRLKRFASGVVVILLLLLIGAIGFIVWGLAELASENQAQALLLAGLCLAAGLAGSALSALISLADRLSNGWELEDGTKLPLESKEPEKFGQRMVPWFLIRPFLGVSMGLAIYLGLSAGLIGATEGSATEDALDAGLRLTFFALLAGLFAKKFLESLRRAFDAFVGSD
jgi:hypothetical protein